MPNLLFCMTPGAGLNTWKNNGSLNRELKTYLEYVRRGWKVKVLTFDKDELSELPEGVTTVSFPQRYFLWLLPWTYRKLSKWADVIKTNQSNKAFLYTRTARSWKKPILLRCGYVHGEYLETTIGLTPKVKFYQWLEARAFQEANHCQVPTEELSEWVQKRYKIPRKRISVVPNFADTDIFKPIEGIQKKEKSVISVGRLVPDKQFDLLIKACAEIPGSTLTIVGEGSEKKYLENLAKELDVNLNLLGNLPNEELPGTLQEHQVFAITSIWEGHPKALIEAMACGLACIGVNSTGLKNIIEHNKNGLVVTPDIRNIKNALITLFVDSDLRCRLGQYSKGFAVRNYSFLECFEVEYQTISKIINQE